MSTVESIEEAILELEPKDFARLADWVRERDDRDWDAQMDRDAASGKLRFLADEALAERDSAAEWP